MTLSSRREIWLLCVLVTGCDFTRVVGRNARWFFSTPRAPPRQAAPLHDGPLSITWVGHATVLVQVFDRAVLTDPVFTEVVGGFSRRLVQPGVSVERLPGLSAVLVSHRHFDHLSRDSLRWLAPRTGVIVTPEGAGADVPRGPAPIAELPWWRSMELDGLRITAVPVAHEGTRLLFDGAAHPRAFTGYVIEYRGVTVFFAGDTAYERLVFERIRERFPRIDVALLPIGPVSPERMMRPHHLDPAQAIQAFRDLGARRLVPIHFSTFLHSFDAPGDCEALFDGLLAKEPGLEVMARRLEVGERLSVELERD